MSLFLWRSGHQPSGNDTHTYTAVVVTVASFVIEKKAAQAYNAINWSP